MLQYLVWVVQSNVLRSYTGVAGPAEVLLAKRLMDITRAVSNADTTGRWELLVLGSTVIEAGLLGVVTRVSVEGGCLKRSTSARQEAMCAWQCCRFLSAY